ncbi:MAG TPA: HIRAN domain-containing protein [Burkholderiales bacterium]|nr:HIRAN domain-containing protein [Burkholderiales bacterium]
MDITFKVTGHQQTFRTTVAGVTHQNADGTDRQAILKALRPGEELRLEHDAGNPYDKFAVAVFRTTGEQVGYVPAGDVRLANHIDSGGTVAARVVSITGGPGFLGLIFKAFRKSYGCVIEVEKGDPNWKEIAPYMEKSRDIEELIKTTNVLEETDPTSAISNYRKAIKEIVALDSAGLIASSWRRAHYPINRISLLLEKTGDHQGALDAILAYEEYGDSYGISSADKKSVAARKVRLIGRLAGGKKNGT